MADDKQSRPIASSPRRAGLAVHCSRDRLNSETSHAEAVARETRRLIDFAQPLGDEFYPAHLSVALIDAVFSVRLSYESRVVPIIRRYCEHFGLSRTRPDRRRTPRAEEQETLADLIGHYERYGLRRMEAEVFRSRYRSPGTWISKADNVYRAAVELRKAGLNHLQDAAAAPPRTLKSALLPLRGIGPRTVHMFLMYVGNEEFVKGDIHVCRFVADCLGRQYGGADEAERIVQRAARLLGISPRCLDYAIWSHQSGNT